MMAESSTDVSRADVSASLPVDYYVAPFMTVLAVVERSCGPILLPAERRWADVVRGLPAPARRLYIRLMMRRGCLFRLERLRYPEIADLAEARQALIAAGLIVSTPPTSLAALADAFTVRELSRLLELPGKPGDRRRDRVAALLARDRPGDRETLAGASLWLGPLGHDLYAVYRLCFFGNLRQDLSEFVLRELGAVRHAGYPIERDGALFRTRHQLECHLRYYECELLFALCAPRDAQALASVCDRLPPHVPGDAHLERRLDRLRVALARRFERLGDADSALHLYLGSCRPPARERAVRLLLARGDESHADTLLDSMRREPRSDAEADFATRYRPVVGRRARAFRPRTTSLALFSDGCRVERAARDYYARDGQCFWVENRLLGCVAGLWFWDVIFAAVPGAFFHPFQSAPADFRERSFRQARASLFEQRLQALDAPDAADRLYRHVVHYRHLHRGTANPLVAWDGIETGLLELALQRIPPQHWRAMFERLFEDPGENASGMPDLVRFPDAGGYEFIEIKGPGDALQAHQRRWLQHFERHGIVARVVNVRWARSVERE